MTWLELLKAIPAPAEIEGNLMSEEGLNRIALEFERALESGETRNLRTSRKKIEQFAAGETGGIPSDIAEEIIERAKRAKETLDELFKDRDAQGKKLGPRTTPKITDELLTEAISEYNDGNKEKLINWLGENKENRHTKSRQKILRNNREAIRNLPTDDDDLFYVTFKKGTKYVTQPTPSDEPFSIDDAKQAFSEIEGIEIEEDKSIIPPERMNKSEYTKFENVIEQLKADKKSVYKLKGKRIPSTLWSVVGDELSSDEIRQKERFEEDGVVAYRGNVTTSQQVLDYFELLTKKGWGNKTIFMPDSILSQKKDSQAMNSIIGGGQTGGWGAQKTISTNLKTILQNPTFDTQKMLETKETERLMIPQQLRKLIAGNEMDEETKELIGRAQITSDELNNLRTAAQKTGPSKYIDWPKFQKVIQSRKNATLKDSFDKLQGAMGGVMENLFNEEEVKFFEGLKGKTEDEVEEEISEFYGVDEDTVLDSEVTIPTRRIVRAENIFVPTSASHYKLDTSHAHRDRDTFTRVFRTFRNNKYSIDVEGESVESADEQTNVKSLAGTGVLDLIMDIDFYYHRKLIEEWNNVLDEEDNTRRDELIIELLPKLKEEYPKIIEALVTATNDKMNHIIQNREDYIKAMRFKVKGKRKKQTYEILNKLSEKNLIVKTGGNENE